MNIAHLNIQLKYSSLNSDLHTKESIVAQYKPLNH